MSAVAAKAAIDLDRAEDDPKPTSDLQARSSPADVEPPAHTGNPETPARR